MSSLALVSQLRSCRTGIPSSRRPSGRHSTAWQASNSRCRHPRIRRPMDEPRSPTRRSAKSCELSAKTTRWDGPTLYRQPRWRSTSPSRLRRALRPSKSSMGSSPLLSPSRAPCHCLTLPTHPLSPSLIALEKARLALSTQLSGLESPWFFTQIEAANRSRPRSRWAQKPTLRLPHSDSRRAYRASSCPSSSEPATSTFTFDLPPHLAIHPRIHASKLRPHFPADSDRFPSLAFLNPPPVVRATDSPDAQWEVEKVVGDRLVRGRLKYKVRWRGYSAASDGWIDAEELRQDAPDVVNDHERAKADRRRDRPAGRKKKARARLSALLASLSLPTFRSGGVSAGQTSLRRPLSFAPTRLPILSLFPALSYRTSLTLLLLANDTLYRAGPKVPGAASRRRRRT